VPVASREANEKVKANPDEVVCLDAPHDIQAVRQVYEDFPQVDDAQVGRILRAFGGRPVERSA
jgi:putative phosphoribosyl transferase